MKNLNRPPIHNYKKEIEQDMKSAILWSTQIEPVLSLLLDFGISATKLGKILGIRQPTMSLYTTGRRNIPEKHVNKLYELLKLTLKEAEDLKLQWEFKIKNPKPKLPYKHLYWIRDFLTPEEKEIKDDNELWRFNIFCENIKRAKALLKNKPKPLSRIKSYTTRG